MRGKVDTFDWAERLARITPAYAGKRSDRGVGSTTVRDHPRLCGEKQLRDNFLRQGAGSPPPMRGKAFPVYSARAVLRITPAYAGKSGKRSGRIGAAEDHPRLCGEKGRPPKMSRPSTGSPPPMRGKGSSSKLSSL